MKEHPRVIALRNLVLSLQVDENYRRQLLQSIITYADQIISGPPVGQEEGWDDLGALHQITLSDAMEYRLQALIARDRVYH